MSINKKNILVFPCGSEIGLEIYRSLKWSAHFSIIGASSVDDHGRFVYEQYLGEFPFVTDKAFIPYCKEIVANWHIDAIFPANDLTNAYLKRHEQEIGCMVLGSCLETVEICLSKHLMYSALKDIIPVPELFPSLDQINQYPVFGKKDIGHSSIGTKKLDNRHLAEEYISNTDGALICEYLPGEEYTVDCFTDKNGSLLFYGVRIRERVSNGISVHTIPYPDDKGEFSRMVNRINETIHFRGAWFAQFKRKSDGTPCLLEIAARLGGSSSLFRPLGINFALLTVFDAFGYDVSIVHNNGKVEMDRALDNMFKLDTHFSEVFVDFDDCLCIDKHFVNPELIAFLFQCLNDDKRLTLLTHHDQNISESLSLLRLSGLFDRIIQIDRTKKKSDYIDNSDSIFIDDSFAERRDVSDALGIPVFGTDMIRCLLKI